MVNARTKVIPFATMIGKSLIRSPYNSHKNTPAVNMLYINNEIPSVFFSLMVLIVCGRKDSVVSNAAIYPKICPISNVLSPPLFGFRY
jgi:hypothetical protein